MTDREETAARRALHERFAIYWNAWRKRGAAKMDHRLWAYWAIFGRYPR